MAVLVTFFSSRDGGGDETGQAATVGITQGQPVRARVGGGTHGGQGVVAIGAEAVEEVLGVEDDFLAVLFQKRHAVGDHGQVVFGRGAEHVGHVQKPGLAKDGHGGRAGGHQGLHVLVVGRRLLGVAGAAEGGQLGLLEAQLGGAAKEFHVLGIRAGIAALDVLDAEPVEQPGNLDLVLDREG
jgi:hypothetical protein